MKDKETTPGSMASYDSRASSRSYSDDYSTYDDDFEDGNSLRTRSRSPSRAKSPRKEIKGQNNKSKSDKKSKQSISFSYITTHPCNEMYITNCQDYNNVTIKKIDSSIAITS